MPDIDNKTRLVRHILNKTWNPIGLNLTADDDEYAEYAYYIVQQSAWTEEKLANYLLHVEKNQIGLTLLGRSEARANTVAREITKAL